MTIFETLIGESGTTAGNHLCMPLMWQACAEARAASLRPTGAPCGARHPPSLEHETGHVLDALAQRPGHRGGHGRQRRQGSGIGIMLARRVPGQHPGCHRRKRAFGRQAPTVLPVPDRPGRGGLQRYRQPRPPRSRATPPCPPDHDTALHPPPLPPDGGTEDAGAQVLGQEHGGRRHRASGYQLRST
jgi:hypothetical protein